MYSISICERDRKTRDFIEASLHRYIGDRKLDAVVRTFSSGEEMSRFTGRIDIAILEAELGRLSGIETGYNLLRKNTDIKIIFVADKTNYLDDAMDLQAYRYMTKPLDVVRLYSALDKVMATHSKQTFVSNHTHVTLKEKDIVCVYSYMRKTYVLSSTGHKYPTNISIKEWVERFRSNCDFAQPHYSYIVNMKYIKGFTGKDITLRCLNGVTIKIVASQRMSGDFRSKYNEIRGV